MEKTIPLQFPLIKLAKKLKDAALNNLGSQFPLIKLAKKLKDSPSSDGQYQRGSKRFH